MNDATYEDFRKRIFARMWSDVAPFVAEIEETESIPREKVWPALAEMGAVIPADVEIRVWDSSAEARYLVLPMRPDGTADMSEEQLTGIVTRDSMIGVQRL